MTLHPSLRPHSYQIRRKPFFYVCLSLCFLVTFLLVVRRIFELDFENYDFALVKRDKCEKYYTTSNVEKSTVDVKVLIGCLCLIVLATEWAFGATEDSCDDVLQMVVPADG